MMKHIYILLLSMTAASAGAQNDNNFGNIALTNLGNVANAPVSQAQFNPTGNQQVSFKQVALENNNGAQSGNKFNDNDPQQQALNTDNNVNEAVQLQALNADNVNKPVQLQSVNQSKSPGNEEPSFSLQKPSVSFGGGASRSSGKNHSRKFSKKVKKFNRRMSYVFAKKQKKSYAVNVCFAWAK